MAGASEELRAWVKQSHDRGTLDIIFSCIVTTFLCIWTSVCTNAPLPDAGYMDVILDRFYMFCLGSLGPEFVLVLAAGQYYNARASVKTFASAGHPNWTMKHAFFADMGGVHLKIRDLKSFPINSCQIHFLVSKGLMEYPLIEAKAIDDKNKSDVLAR